MKSHGTTNVGKVRVKNDDSFYCRDGRNGLYIVADGMGGYSGGKIASKISVETVIEFFNNSGCIAPNDTDGLMEEIRAKLNEKVALDKKLSKMGTTLTCCFSHLNKFSCIHVGDTRAYLISDGLITQLTEDHTVVNFKFKRGEITPEEAKTYPNKNMLIKAIVPYEKVKPDFFTFDLKEGEILILCSDGLTKHVSRSEILDITTKYTEPEDISFALQDVALSRGGTDNISIVVVRG